jgi:hypothetical protein
MFDDGNSFLMQVLSGDTIDDDTEQSDLTDDDLVNRGIKQEIIKNRLRPRRALVPWQTTLPGSQVSGAITN